MKRYRILSFDFDARVHTLTMVIQDGWEERTKQMHRTNKENVRAGLAAEFGPVRFEQKIRDFIDLGAKPFSIVAYHNKFFEQARSAFVGGAYYPALTATCALGERILNHLMLLLRDDFRGTPEYKNVYRKRNFVDWNIAISTLSSWGVLLPATAEAFRKLSLVRNRHAIHFNPDTENNDRALALEAIGLMTAIISSQFSAFADLPWCLTSVPGEIYIKRAAESEPFVRKVYLPNCLAVGPYHIIEQIVPGMPVTVRDDHKYEEREISDEEFAELRQGPRPA